MDSGKSPSRYYLNPLAFPVETDMRFLLLLIAAEGTTVGLADFSIYTIAQYLPIQDNLARDISTISAFIMMLIVFVLSHQRAKRAAQRLIKYEHWSSFPPSTNDPIEHASLQRMHTHIDQIVAQLPDISAQPRLWYWNDTPKDGQLPVGVAFGYRKQQYICLNEGLHGAFLKAPDEKWFHSVFLHELGHIANRDISRTTFSIELGRTFTQAMLVLAAITEGYIAFQLMRRFVNGTTNEVDIHAIGIMAQTAIGTALVISLIEIIRASVLRVREYYADSQAWQWLGIQSPLLELLTIRSNSPFERTSSPATFGIVAQQALHSPWSIRKIFRDYLAPLHPSHRQRIKALTHASSLFEVDLWTAGIAGLLSSLALNANSLTLTIPLRLGGFVNTWLSGSLNSQQSSSVQLAIFVLSTVLTLGAVALLIGMFIILFLAPLVGTVGVMVERAAFVDHTAHQPAKLLSLPRLIRLSLVTGCGIIIGGTLTPVPGILSLQNSDWLLAPIFMLVWAGVLFVWLVSLHWIASRAYRSHTGTKPPVARRRCIAALAALAITPMLLFTVFGQGAVTKADTASTLTAILPFLLAGWLLSFPVSFIIWMSGALLMYMAGWFGAARCTSCKQIANHTSAMTLHCAHCGHALKAWALINPPIDIPLLSTLNIPTSDTAPPL